VSEAGAERRGVVPPVRTSVGVVAVGLIAVAVGAWVASWPHGAVAVGFMRWINDPPPPLSWLLAASNPLMRPVPLTVVVTVLVAWILARARGWSQRYEVVRAGVISFVVAEVIAQSTKRLTQESRPHASLPDLDTHGYPGEPHGLSYPSAHTAVAVGLVAALWPWLTLPQRVAGATVTVLVMLNRLYIGAHWPIDLWGGIAAGAAAAAAAWLVADRWPFRRP
jgi:undecaprenyl-diphosphatase